MFKWIKKKLEECDIRLARVNHKYYSDQINREVKHIQKNVGLSMKEVEEFERIYKMCEDEANGKTVDSKDILVATINNTFDVPIAGIYWLDGWFKSRRFDQDRFESDLIGINPQFANKIKHTRDIREGDYIVVLESNSRTLKTKIRDFGGRILRDEITCVEYYSRLIKVTKDRRKENEKAYADYIGFINQRANDMVGPYQLNRLNEDVVERYQNIRNDLMKQRPFDHMTDTSVEGTVIDRRYIRTIGDVSYMNFKQGKPKTVSIGDIAYMSSDCSFMPARKVKILEIKKNGFLVEDMHSGKIGEVDRLYDATGAYLTGYFSDHETTATLKWGQDHNPKKYKIW